MKYAGIARKRDGTYIVLIEHEGRTLTCNFGELQTVVAKAELDALTPPLSQGERGSLPEEKPAEPPDKYIYESSEKTRKMFGLK